MSGPEAKSDGESSGSFGVDVSEASAVVSILRMSLRMEFAIRRPAMLHFPTSLYLRQPASKLCHLSPFIPMMPSYVMTSPNGHTDIQSSRFSVHK
jgi:hypothetical protein